MNFSSSGSQPSCTVGDYLSTAHSSGLVGYHIKLTSGVIIGGTVGTHGTGAGILAGARTGDAIGSGFGYSVGGLVGIGFQYNACY